VCRGEYWDKVHKWHGAESICLEFDDKGGVFEYSSQTIRGVSIDGAPMEIKFEDVAAIEIVMNLAGSTTPVFLKLDALTQGEHWRPGGRIVTAVLVSGQTIDFSSADPIIDLAEGVVCWPATGGAVSDLRLDDVFFLEVESEWTPSGKTRTVFGDCDSLAQEVAEHRADGPTPSWAREPRTWCWLGLGASSVGQSESPGLSGGIGLYHQFKATQLIGIRYLVNEEEGWIVENRETAWEGGILYGRVLNSSRDFIFAVSGGVAVVGGQRRIPSEIPGYSEPESFGPVLGFPMEALFHWRPSSILGFSARGFANINSEVSFVGFLISCTLGDLK